MGFRKNHKGSLGKSEAEESMSESGEKLCTVDLKVMEGATSQTMQATSASCKGKEIDSQQSLQNESSSFTMPSDF